MDEPFDQNNQTESPCYSRKKIAVWAAVFLAAVIFLACVVGVFWAWREIYWPLDKNGVVQGEFVVEKGQSVKSIAAALVKQNFIRSAFWFEAYARWRREGGVLQAGHYALSSDLNVPQMVEMFSGGKIIFNEFTITFPEGFKVSQIRDRLFEQGISGAQLIDKEIVDSYQIQYKFLIDAPTDAGLEGFLFPDTYRFKLDLKKEDIIKKFLDNFDKKLTPDLREAIARQRRSLYDVIILASIVQQEAINNEEMPLIAGVFANRLARGMLLQSDATVNYVTGKQLRQITLDDAKIPSFYNTYLHSGLPPGPICNPGLEAIKAAIYPSATDYLYFLHPLDQPAIFSKTLEEHNKNKIKWLGQ